jgi:isopentenyl-diphosphate delta-isomerase
MDDRVVLVDEHDVEIGTAPKLEAHRSGTLHRAFSVFVFDGAGQILLQKRAAHKYHSGGLWTNACCSHPRPGEDVLDAAHRRLREEMGFDCPLQPLFSFVYHAPFPNGLTEHELDHVFVGRFEGQPRPDPEEADDWRWADSAQVLESIAREPESYSAWFRLALHRVLELVRA